jgi:hypothetical protein
VYLFVFSRCLSLYPSIIFEGYEITLLCVCICLSSFLFFCAVRVIPGRLMRLPSCPSPITNFFLSGQGPHLCVQAPKLVNQVCIYVPQLQDVPAVPPGIILSSHFIKILQQLRNTGEMKQIPFRLTIIFKKMRDNTILKVKLFP